MEWLENITNGHAAELIIALALLIIIRVIISLYMASVGKKKGYSDVLHFFICLVFGMIGCAMCAATPDKRLRSEIDELYELYSTLSGEIPTGGEGIIPTTDTDDAPSGTTAYMPSGKGQSGDAQNSAVERIKRFWEKRDE